MKNKLHPLNPKFYGLTGAVSNRTEIMKVRIILKKLTQSRQRTEHAHKKLKSDSYHLKTLTVTGLKGNYHLIPVVQYLIPFGIKAHA